MVSARGAPYGYKSNNSLVAHVRHCSLVGTYRCLGEVAIDFPSFEELARQADAGVEAATDSRQLFDLEYILP